MVVEGRAEVSGRDDDWAFARLSPRAWWRHRRHAGRRIHPCLGQRRVRDRPGIDVLIVKP
jgi:hypothetical protein